MEYVYTNVIEVKIYHVISVEELVSVYIIMMFSMYLSIPLVFAPNVLILCCIYRSSLISWKC